MPIPIGRYLTSIGYVNDYYSLSGTSYKAANICTDKLLFYQNLRHLSPNLEQKSKCTLLNNSFIENLNDLSYPLIIKPRFGSGNRDVIAISNQTSLKNALKNIDIKKEDFLAESLIQGKEFGVNGVVLNGVYNHILIREKLLTPLPYRQCIGNIVHEEIKEISFHLQRIVDKLKLKNSLIIADIIMTNDNKLFTIEVAPRLSGHYLSEFIKIATGIDIIKEWINLALNKPFDFKPRFNKNAIIRYFDFEGKVIPPNFERLKENLGIFSYECNLKGNLEKVKDGASIMSRGYAVLLGNSKKEVILNAEKLIKNFKRNSDG